MALLPPGLTLEDVVTEAEAQGDLANMLIDKWCHGKLSAHALVTEARASVATNRGTVDELLLRLVALNVHNAHRDLVQMLSRRHQEMVPPLLYAHVLTWDAQRSMAVETPLPFCLPHEWLHHLSSEDLASWCSAPPEIEEQTMEWTRRVHLSEPGPPVAPLSVWGDTAPFHTVDSVMLLLWGSLSTEHWRRWWICLLAKSQLCRCGCSGMRTAGSHLGSHMLEPTVLHCRSVPFSGSHGRGVQGSLATESSWQALAFTRCCAAVPRVSYVFQVALHASTAACFLCRGSMDLYGGIPLTDASSSARWRKHIIPAAQWMQ
jgi:hypothetical protein